ncbi:MAG: transporter substrate-binding domain-containing protein [Deltaproteobacteria bacterium]|nr:transporter substrate-binding domain-containing protein [Deltaproteobacteria bacterium]
MKKWSWVLVGLITLTLVFSLSAYTKAGEIQQKLTDESTIEQVMKRKVLRVGMSTFVPWAMQDKTGKLVGFEIDVATRLAKDLGVQVEFVPTKWDGIIPALLTGKFDVIIGGMGIKTERSLKVNFSFPYDMTGQSLAANKEKAKGFKSLADFNKENVELAVRMGTTAVDACKKFMPKAKLRMFDDETKAFQELVNGNVHGVVSSAPRPRFEALQHPDKVFMPLPEDTFTMEPIAFALKKGDVDTLNVFNSWITLVASEGWLKERKAYWFESDEWRKLVE